MSAMIFRVSERTKQGYVSVSARASAVTRARDTIGAVT